MRNPPSWIAQASDIIIVFETNLQHFQRQTFGILDFCYSYKTASFRTTTFDGRAYVHNVNQVQLQNDRLFP